MKKQKEYKVYENARVEELNSYMYAQIPGKGGAAKEVYDVVFNADGERITVSVSMVEFNVLKEGDQGKKTASGKGREVLLSERDAVYRSSFR